MKKSRVSLLDVKEMKTRNDCEIACDCVKRANVVLHVGLCEEIFARKIVCVKMAWLESFGSTLYASNSLERPLHVLFDMIAFLDACRLADQGSCTIQNNSRLDQCFADLNTTAAGRRDYIGEFSWKKTKIYKRTCSFFPLPQHQHLFRFERRKFCWCWGRGNYDMILAWRLLLHETAVATTYWVVCWMSFDMIL